MKISGAGNFRSLGGLTTRDGRRIRGHYLMRSDRLGRLTNEDWQQLRGAGLNTICDLRTVEECQQHPNGVPPALGVMELACEVRNSLRGDQSLMDIIVRDPTDAGGERLMVEMYRRLPQQMAPGIQRILHRLLEGGAPLLVHCTAGKDRTGYAVAMLLHALGVPQEDIELDYLASRSWSGAPLHRNALVKSLGPMIPAEALHSVIDPLLDVRASYIRASFRQVEDEFGSVERYLAAAAGLDAAKLERLRDLALQPPNDFALQPPYDVALEPPGD
jgi:protein-tyrosine phosphatase